MAPKRPKQTTAEVGVQVSAKPSAHSPPTTPVPQNNRPSYKERYSKVGAASALIGIFQVFLHDPSSKQLLSFVAPAIVEVGFEAINSIKPVAVDFFIMILNIFKNKQIEISRRRKYKHWDELISLAENDKNCSPEQIQQLKDAAAKLKVDHAMREITLRSAEHITIISESNQAGASL